MFCYNKDSYKVPRQIQGKRYTSQVIRERESPKKSKG